MFEKKIAKINENIDKAISYRNKMFLRTLLFWGLFGLGFVAHYYDIMTTLVIIAQVFLLLASIPTLLITLFITYVQFFVISKIDQVSFGKGIVKDVVDASRDMAIEKVRSVTNDSERKLKFSIKYATSDVTSEKKSK